MPSANAAVSKIANNICAFLCSDPSVTYLVKDYEKHQGILSFSDEQNSLKTKNSGVMGFEEFPEEKSTLLIRRGAEYCLECMSSVFKGELFLKIPAFYEKLEKVVLLKEFYSSEHCLEESQQIVDSLYILQSFLPLSDHSLFPKVMDVIT